MSRTSYWLCPSKSGELGTILPSGYWIDHTPGKLGAHYVLLEPGHGDTKYHGDRENYPDNPMDTCIPTSTIHRAGAMPNDNRDHRN